NDAEVEEPTQLLTIPSYGDFEIYGSYNNEYSFNPPDILEKLNVYCWQDMNSILVKFTIINRETNTINAIFGYEMVPEVEGSTSGGDTVTFSTLSEIISVRKTESVGFLPLSDDFKSLGAFVWYDEYWLGDTTLYNWLTYNSYDSLFITDPNDPNVDDPVLIPAYNSVNIAPGDSIIQYIAIAYGVNEAEMLVSLQEAQEKYYTLTSIKADHYSIPNGYVLEQNYPNPFNPSTVIKFGIPESSNVILKVFNTLGEEVAELVNENLGAGTYNVNFNASNLPSGMYVYTLQSGDQVISKKMTLIK
ncbi:MAG TPA: T9SS type A sorting domain-containing protein, partial [Ignavibacteriaceae bacterium]